jgi:GNAT superfamily N-acetyltransferase
MIRLAADDGEIAACYGAMRALRPHLQEKRFTAQVRELMAEGYRLAYLEEGGQVVCVAGFRIQSNFFLGRHLYVEDLSTREECRSTGHGTRMLEWLRRLAVTEGCAALDLDSGVQRHLAHRFYFRQGMQIAAYHFLERFE